MSWLDNLLDLFSPDDEEEQKRKKRDESRPSHRPTNPIFDAAEFVSDASSGVGRNLRDTGANIGNTLRELLSPTQPQPTPKPNHITLDNYFPSPEDAGEGSPLGPGALSQYHHQQAVQEGRYGDYEVSDRAAKQMGMDYTRIPNQPDPDIPLALTKYFDGLGQEPEDKTFTLPEIRRANDVHNAAPHNVGADIGKLLTFDPTKDIEIGRQLMQGGDDLFNDIGGRISRFSIFNPTGDKQQEEELRAGDFKNAIDPETNQGRDFFRPLVEGVQGFIDPLIQIPGAVFNNSVFTPQEDRQGAFQVPFLPAETPSASKFKQESIDPYMQIADDWLQSKGVNPTVSRYGTQGLGFGLAALGMIPDVGGAEKGLLKNLPTVFKGFDDVSLKSLEKLRGMSTASKQQIIDIVRKTGAQEGIKKPELEIMQEVLNSYPDGQKVPVDEFAQRVKQKLVPLTPVEANRWGEYSLPDEIRGNTDNYTERVYTADSDLADFHHHYKGDVPAGKNYFAHARTEDLDTPMPPMFHNGSEVDFSSPEFTEFKNQYTAVPDPDDIDPDTYVVKRNGEPVVSTTADNPDHAVERVARSRFELEKRRQWEDKLIEQHTSPEEREAVSRDYRVKEDGQHFDGSPHYQILENNEVIAGGYRTREDAQKGVDKIIHDELVRTAMRNATPKGGGRRINEIQSDLMQHGGEPFDRALENIGGESASTEAISRLLTFNTPEKIEDLLKTDNSLVRDLDSADPTDSRNFLEELAGTEKLRQQMNREALENTPLESEGFARYDRPGKRTRELWTKDEIRQQREKFMRQPNAGRLNVRRRMAESNRQLRKIDALNNYFKDKTIDPDRVAMLDAKKIQAKKQAGYKDSWYERVLREEIKKAAQDGKDYIDVPTGQSAAYIEKYVSPGGNGDFDDLSEFETFNHDGQEYYHLGNTYDDEVLAVPVDRTQTYYQREYINDEISNTGDEMQYAPEDFADPLYSYLYGNFNALPEDMQRELNGLFEDNNFAAHDGDELYGNTRFGEILKENSEHIPWYDVAGDYVENSDVITNFKSYLEDTGEYDRYEWMDDDTVLGWDSDDTEYLSGSGDGVEDTAAIHQQVSDDQSAVMNFYDRPVRKFVEKKYKAQQITDDNGLTWMRIPLKPEYATAPVEAFAAAPVGAVAGVEEEEDDQGNKTFSYDPLKGAAGVAIGATAAKGRKALKDLPLVEKATTAAKSAAKDIKTKALEAGAKNAKEMTITDTGKLTNGKFQFDLKNLDTSDDVKNLIKEVAEANQSGINTARRGTITHTQTTQLADALGMSVDEVIKRNPGKTYNAEQMVAATKLAVGVQEDLAKAKKALAEAVANGADNIDELTTKRDIAAMQAAGILKSIIGSSSEAGRALNARKIMAEAMSTNNAKAAKQAMKLFAGDEDKFAKVMGKLSEFDDEDTLGMVKYLRSIKPSTTWDKIEELWYNSVLSNPATHIVNSTSNAMMNALFLPERALSGAIDTVAAVGGKPRERYAGEAIQGGKATLHGIVEGVRRGGYVLRHGVSEADALKFDLGHSQALKGKVGTAINVPTRLLATEDEFFKAITFEQEKAMLAWRQVKNEGLKGKGATQRFGEIMADPDPTIIESAWDKARQRAFQADTSMGDRVRALRDWELNLTSTLAVRPGKFIIPFVTTAINVIKEANKRSPLGVINVAQKVATKAPRGEVADAMAQTMIGTAIAIPLAMYAWDHKITGAAPPANKRKERDAFYADGKLPYSIQIGDQWVQYQRIEPFNTILTQIAGLKDRYEADGKIDAGDIASLLSDLGRNAADQTWLTGIGNIIDAIEDPERYGSRFISDMVGGFIPSFVAAGARATDRTVRRPEGLTDSLKGRIPGLSDDVPAFPNDFTGESTRYNPGWQEFTGLKSQPITDSYLQEDQELIDLLAANDRAKGPEPKTGKALTNAQREEQRKEGLEGIEKSLDTATNEVVANYLYQKEQSMDDDEFKELVQLLGKKKIATKDVISKLNLLRRGKLDALPLVAP